MRVADAGPCRTVLYIIDFAGARAFSQWERLVPAPADLSVVNMLLILSPELILQEQEHSANGSG